MSDDINDDMQDGAHLRRMNQRGADLRGRADAAGAGAAKAGPAARAEPSREPVGRDDDGVTRRSRNQRDTGMFHVPAQSKKPNWDYQWIATKVVNEPVDASVLAGYRDQGWRPVTGVDHPDLMLPGAAAADPIQRHGQMLVTRPMRLTIEARQEDYDFAERQKFDRMRAASGGDLGDGALSRVPGIKPQTLQVEIEGEVGIQQR